LEPSRRPALRTEPTEPLCLEFRWASLMSYGLTVGLLADLLPMEHQLSTSTVSRHVHQVAERLEQELGDEQPFFIEGCPVQWYELPEPAAPLTVCLDGGYVHARTPERRKDGSFEVIVGKSTTGEGTTTSFGLVSGYDTKPRRRLFETVFWKYAAVALCVKESTIEEVLFGFVCYTSQGAQLDFSQTRWPELHSCVTERSKGVFA
jgi:hypothetical protein